MMTRTTLALLAGTSALLLAAGTHAQVSYGIDEVTVDGALNVANADGESFTSFTFGIGYGYFVTDAIELGATLGVNKFEGRDTFGDVGGFAELHFGAVESLTVPYVGAAFGVGYGNDIDNPWMADVHGGLKWFIASGGAIRLEPYYQRVEFDSGGIDNVGVRWGVSLFFR